MLKCIESAGGETTYGFPAAVRANRQALGSTQGLASLSVLRSSAWAAA